MFITELDNFYILINYCVCAHVCERGIFFFFFEKICEELILLNV